MSQEADMVLLKKHARTGADFAEDGSATLTIHHCGAGKLGGGLLGTAEEN